MISITLLVREETHWILRSMPCSTCLMTANWNLMSPPRVPSKQGREPNSIFRRRISKRMGASLNLELKGSYEWQTSSTVDGESSVMNSYELGAALSLNFPRLVLPWIRNRVDPFRFPSETNFKIYAEQVKSCPLLQDVVIWRYCIL